MFGEKEREHSSAADGGHSTTFDAGMKSVSDGRPCFARVMSIRPFRRRNVVPRPGRIFLERGPWSLHSPDPCVDLLVGPMADPKWTAAMVSLFLRACGIPFPIASTSGGDLVKSR